MTDYLTHFFIYNKIYLFSGAALLLFILLPTQKKVSSNTRKTLIVFVIIWIICFAYRINSGKHFTDLFDRKDTFGDESEAGRLKGGPFNKYYSNEAGRKTKE
jgi:hypothetical protein